MFNFICTDCGHKFDEPEEYSEPSGLDDCPMKYKGCPKCGGNYEELGECDYCGNEVPRSSLYLVVSEKGHKIHICEDCYDKQ